MFFIVCCLLFGQHLGFVGASSEVFVVVCWLSYAVVVFFCCWFYFFGLTACCFFSAALEPHRSLIGVFFAVCCCCFLLFVVVCLLIWRFFCGLLVVLWHLSFVGGSPDLFDVCWLVGCFVMLVWQARASSELRLSLF